MLIYLDEENLQMARLPKRSDWSEEQGILQQTVRCKSCCNTQTSAVKVTSSRVSWRSMCAVWIQQMRSSFAVPPCHGAERFCYLRFGTYKILEED